MTTRGLEDLDGGLGSCLPSNDLPLLEEPHSGRRPDSKARGASRPADSSSRTHVLQYPGPAGATEKELAAKEGPGTSSKRTPKAETSPRSIPEHRSSQIAPPLKPPPPLRDDLPWRDLTLNKCLVLASLVALLGWILQLCQNAVAGEVAVAAPKQWVPPSLPPKKPAVLSLPKPPLLVPHSGPPEAKPGPPGPQALKQMPEATEAQGEPEESKQEASGEERAPLGDRGSQEKPRKEKPRKGEKRKKEKPRREKPRREERPRATREPRPSLPRRWEARERGHQRQTWAPRRCHELDDRPRQKPHGGKGCD
ncbi:junctional sarcoplasmic reticulum protein 1 [Phodopus roborovskii]|uniref:Jsrp1 protein n=1 Tax=Phodopus roborovskii TaxID=109678 RepID=A0AAU9YXD8_PHORO|nr:junctional sarcoplasmic reticulum protein 1 [Phodopus roborovskii]CAH6779262.1 Jsrp1 [Phodopus roborovskii]